MEQEPLQRAEKWVEETFGAAELGNPRRTDRLLNGASALAENPSALLPHALESVSDSISNPGHGVLYGDIPHKT